MTPGSDPVIPNPFEDGIYQDMEIFYSDWANRTAPGPGLDIHEPNVKYINCIIHDLSGIGLWTDAVGAELYGCIIFHNGWNGTDRGHGHGLYMQNDTPKRVIKDCIIFDNFGYGVHAYTQTGKINNIELDGCVCFENGALVGQHYGEILVGGWVVAENVTVKNCMTFGGASNVGYTAGATNVILENNYMPGGIYKDSARRW
jgi:hypothetical protein